MTKNNTMKRIFVFSILFSMISLQLSAQDTSEDKSKRPSPPATVSQKLASGATISIDYSQPSVKGRTIGKDLEPMEGQVWRTGANEATVFQTDQDVMINGVKLPAGKYGFFTIFQGNEVIFIFNKTSEQWGAFKYKEEDDQLRIKSKLKTGNAVSEKMTFMIDKNGKVALAWGDRRASFKVK